MITFFKKHKFWLIFSFTFFGIIFFSTAILNHYLFKTYVFDYGNYNFALWDYAHFNVNQIETIKPLKMTFLQDHFSFMLMYFVPIHWLLNWITGTYTLLIIQTSIILLSGWALYKLIELKTKDVWLGLAAVIHYFIIQGRYSAFTADCNIGIMTTCLVPFFLYFFESKRFLAATIIFVLALFSRENMPLWFIFISIVLIFWHRKERKEVFISLAYIVSSILYFVILFKVFIPLFETPEKHYHLFNYSALGANPSEAVSFLLKHPLESIKLLFINHLNEQQFDGIKGEFYYVYLLSGGFLLLLRPQYLIWFIPIVAQKMYNDSAIRWSIEWYYSIEVATIMSVTVFIIISEFKSKFRYGLSIGVCILTLMITGIKLNSRNREMPWWSTSKEAIFAENFFKTDIPVKETHALLKTIPKEAKLSASNKFLPHLSQRKYGYFFPSVYDADYIIAYKAHDCYLVEAEKYNKVLSEYRNNPEWDIYAENTALIILKKKSGK